MRDDAGLFEDLGLDIEPSAVARSARQPDIVRWANEEQAFRIFATSKDATQSAAHIKPLHHYVACRLVIEGGFRPDEITPRPPFTIEERRGERHLVYAPHLAGGGEATILGGLKTKNVDVVVMKPGIGPVIAVSCKGMTGALRNLTNRMEETIGETTNLHITYPALVFGYLFLLRANRATEAAADIASDIEADDRTAAMRRNDVALGEDGSPVEALLRFHNALRGMTGRRSIRDDIARYESVALALVDAADKPGQISREFPPHDSGIRTEAFFSTLYARYDERFVVSAPVLAKVTRRLEWSSASPAFVSGELAEALGYEPRLA
ncbi:MAG: hypothetical protein JWM87_1177 [Candidatus Eremiobacteraeota bacterium]|nr:hypothetical protein [Candidatus Eremiobacteraeota bacterium]